MDDRPFTMVNLISFTTFEEPAVLSYTGGSLKNIHIAYGYTENHHSYMYLHNSLVQSLEGIKKMCTFPCTFFLVN
jgi:hypothetical protein